MSNGTLTVSCPTNQGNARVYVLDGPGKIGEDGPFLYTSTAASADNSALATDPGTTWNIDTTTTHRPDTASAIYCYFINSGKWSTIRTYIWDANNSNAAYAGDWSNRYTFTSSDIVGQTTDGYDVYKWSYTGTLTNIPTGIIFTSSSDSERAGSGDLFVNGGYYNAKGLTTEPTLTGIRNITSASYSTCVIYNLRGQRVAEVHNISDAKYILRSGVYITKGKKFVIR